MKVLVALLLCSLAVNAALFIRFRESSAENSLARSNSGEATSAALGRRANDEKRIMAELFDSTKTDSVTLKARLEAAGFPPEAVRAAVIAQLRNDNRKRQEALLQGRAPAPYWETGSGVYGITSVDPEAERELGRLSREFQTRMRETFGQDDPLSGPLLTSYEQRWGPLPKEKLEAVRRITNDYAELQRELLGSRPPSTVSKEEQEKFALLQKEQRADLTAALTPEELFEYDLRTSPTALRTRFMLQSFDPSEEEYRAIFRAQYAYDQATGLNAGSTATVSISSSQGGEERAAILQSLKGVLSDERLADYEFVTDPFNNSLARLTSRLGLPIQSAREVNNLRLQTSQAVSQLRADRTLNPEERTARIADVLRTTTDQITQNLGPEGYQAYMESGGSWLTNLRTSNSRPAPRTP